VRLKVFDSRFVQLVNNVRHPRKGFEEITFKVKTENKESEEKIREFIKWAERSPPHATLRRAVRLIGIFHLNGKHLTTAVYHPDQTEWR
jgi:hypothetical protein